MSNDFYPPGLVACADQHYADIPETVERMVEAIDDLYAADLDLGNPDRSIRFMEIASDMIRAIESDTKLRTQIIWAAVSAFTMISDQRRQTSE